MRKMMELASASADPCNVTIKSRSTTRAGPAGVSSELASRLCGGTRVSMNWDLSGHCLIKQLQDRRQGLSYGISSGVVAHQSG